MVASIDKIYQRSRSLKVTPFTLGKPDFIVIREKGLNSTNKRSNYGNQLNLCITFRFLKNDYLFIILAVLGFCCCATCCLVVVAGDYSPAVAHGLLIVVASLVGAKALGCMGFSSCGLQA